MNRVGRRFGVVLGVALLVVACTSETEVAIPAPTTTVATTTTTVATATVPETTSTTTLEQRIAEITEIIREVEFGWFDAIYRKDEEALRDVVAVQESIDTATALMADAAFFTDEPDQEAMLIEVGVVLIDRSDCLAVAYRGDATAFRGSTATGELTAVYWPRASDGTWRRAYQGDEWQAACDDFSRANELP